MNNPFVPAASLHFLSKKAADPFARDGRQEDVAAAWSRARELLDQWPARRRTAAQRVRAGSGLYRQTLSRIEKEDPICLERPNVQAAMESISRLEAAFAAAQAAPVCDLIELERLSRRRGEETNAFDEHIREPSGLKRMGEEELDQLERTFRSSYRQAAPYVNRGATKDAFKLRRSEIKRCLKEGRYEEIPPQLQAIRDLLEQIGDACRKGGRPRTGAPVGGRPTGGLSRAGPRGASSSTRQPVRARPLQPVVPPSSARPFVRRPARRRRRERPEPVLFLAPFLELLGRRQLERRVLRRRRQRRQFLGRGKLVSGIEQARGRPSTGGPLPVTYIDTSNSFT